MDTNLLGFNVDFETDSRGSYLVLSKEGFAISDIIEYQVEMLRSNNIRGVIGPEVREKDTRVKLYYKISGFVTLTNFLKRQKLDKDEFLLLLERIICILLESNGYFLDDSSYILNEDFILIDPESREIAVLYLPVEVPRDITQIVKALVINLIFHRANIEIPDEYLTALIGRIKDEEFTVSSFAAQVKEMRTGYDESLPKDIELQGEGFTEENSSGVTAEPKEVHRKKNGAILPAVLAVLVITAVILKEWKSLRLLPVTQSAQFKMVLAAGVTGFGLITLLIYLLNRRAKLRGDFGQVRVEIPGPEYEELIAPCPPVQTAQSDALINNGHSDIIGEDNSVDRFSDETVVLDGANYPLLRAINGSEVIIISKNEFVLGRNYQTCDYAIHNWNIGRAHSQINCKEGIYYIIDLGSKNGTFLNGLRLVSNKPYELKDNDRVTMANLDFCFNLR